MKMGQVRNHVKFIPLIAFAFATIFLFSAASTTYIVDPSCADQNSTSCTRSIKNILAAIGTTKNATIVLDHSQNSTNTTYVVATTCDWSAYANITFKIVRGAVISHGAFTVKMPFPDAGRYQIFSGSGLVTFYGNIGNYLTEWFGAQFYDTIAHAVAGTDSTTAVQYTLNTAASSNFESALKAGGIVELSAGVIKTGAVSLAGKPFVSIIGKGPSSTTWLATGTTNPLLFIGETAISTPLNYNSFIRDIKFQGYGGATTSLIKVSKVTNWQMQNCWIESDAGTTTGIAIDGSINISLTDVIARGVVGHGQYGIDIYDGDYGGANAIPPNKVSIIRPTMSGWGKQAIRYRHGSGLHVNGPDIEQNGTVGDATTGAILLESFGGTGEGIGAVIDGVGWFENNNGSVILAQTPLIQPSRVIIRDVMGFGATSPMYGLNLKGVTYDISSSVFQNASVYDIYIDANSSGQGRSCIASTASILGTGSNWFPYPAGTQGILSTANTTAYQTRPMTGATPSVAGGGIYSVSNATATTITNFLNGVPGQTFKIITEDGNTTIANNSNIVTGTGSNVNLSSGNMIRTFTANGSGVWIME